MRFLEVGAGDLLKIGQERSFLPVEVITLVAEDRVTIETGRKGGRAGPLDTKIALPSVNTRRE